MKPSDVGVHGCLGCPSSTSLSCCWNKRKVVNGEIYIIQSGRHIYINVSLFLFSTTHVVQAIKGIRDRPKLRSSPKLGQLTVHTGKPWKKSYGKVMENWQTN